MRENTFDFNDFIDQLDQSAKYGADGRLAQDDSRYGQQSSPSKHEGWMNTPDCSQTCHCVLHDT